MLKNKDLLKASYKFHSFDVFDTCLIRTCGKPRIVFYLMALELYGEDAPEVLIYDFVNARINAEKKALAALKSSSREDVSIQEIYASLNAGILESFGLERLIQLELSLEEKVLRPIQSTRSAIDFLHNQGKSVCYISDMYLPANFIKKQLVEHGFWKEGDKLYVSNEVGLTKDSGALFELIAQKENVGFKEWFHCGDDKKNDHLVPKRKGISTKLLRQVQYTRYELEWIKSATLSDNPLQGVLMAGIARTIRLCSENSAITDMVSDVIAPLFVPFVAGVLEDAHKRGINKIYFLARDAYIFLQIAKMFSANYPDIQFSYLYGSRRTFYLAGIDQGTKEEFRRIMGGAVGRTPVQMMRRINIDVHLLNDGLDAFAIDQSFYDQKLNEGNVELFLDLLTHKNVLPEILQEARKQREIARDYFDQEGMLDKDSSIAIVDLGWTRTCQKSINSILGDKQVFGYYFGVFKDRLLPDEAGEYMAGFFPEEIIWSARVDRSLNSGFVAVAEQVFAMTTHGSTIAYKKKNDKVYPEFDTKENSGRYAQEYIDKLYENIVFFAKEYATFHWLMTNAKSAITSCGLNSLYLFIEKPKRRETIIFDKFKVGNNLNDNEKIITHLSPRILFQFLKSKFDSNEKPSGLLWIQGSVAYTFGQAGLQVFHLARKLKDWLSK
ncbi:hypothetical protein [uncultured Sunxiuqinia sp.]|uniref:HAD family hydrolase n=1 Tax=uncultured Sunxiuqinia sp. TaxID=1573825 RepID=UPI0026128BED|nr:hypothetical protein [uncultured Sunxiuqinia sp.]